MKSDRGFARYFAYLNYFVLSMLRARARPATTSLLIVGWAFVGAASYMLISFWYRRTTATQGRHQGVRDQRRRRRRARDRDVHHPRPHRHRRLPGQLPCRQPRLRSRSDEPRDRMPDVPHRRVRQVRPGAAAHVASGRDGGPDAGLLPDPCRDDGDGRRLPDRAPARAVRAAPRPRRTSARSSAARRC